MNSERNVSPNYEKVRDVFLNYDYRGRNVFLIRGRNVFPKYEEGRNVFPNDETGAKRLS